MVNEPSLFSHTRNCIYEMNAFHTVMFPYKNDYYVKLKTVKNQFQC